MNDPLTRPSPTDATLSDAGPYTCTARNVYGTDTLTVNVTVRGAGETDTRIHELKKLESLEQISLMVKQMEVLARVTHVNLKKIKKESQPPVLTLLSPLQCLRC